MGAGHEAGHLRGALTTSLQLHQAGPQLTQLVRLRVTGVGVRTEHTLEALCGLDLTPHLAQQVSAHEVIRVCTCDVLLGNNGGYGARGHDVIVNHRQL